MPRDPRIRYAILLPFTKKNGEMYWLRVGLAYRNDDGTIDAYCDALLVGHRFRLRELTPDEVAEAKVTGPPS